MALTDRNQTTLLLRRAVDGEAEASESLAAIVYDELHRLAGRLLAGGAPQTLGPTALIHEAWLRLVDADDVADWNGRGHFVRVAARAMRYILIDRARARAREKRGGGRAKVSLDEAHLSAGRSDECFDDVLALEESLERLAEREPRLAEIVELRFFGGMNHREIATALETSLRTVERGWRLARAYLLADLSEEGGRSSTGGDQDPV